MAFLKFVFVLLILIPMAAFMLYILKNLAQQIPKQKKSSKNRRRPTNSSNDALREEFYRKEKL